jgi:hypothetical protein
MRDKLFWFISVILWLCISFLFLFLIFSGNIPFWYDPARDLLSAWDNLHKITLIGSTSGIPGIFYGPYWIWLLSIPLFFSKDPRLATFAVCFLPYMLLFPLVLYQFKKYFGRNIIFVLWVFFILGFKSYPLFIWNPNISPLLFLTAVYLILSAEGWEKSKINYKRLFFAGLISGLALNFNMSFGSVFILSCVLFSFLVTFISKNEKIVTKIKEVFLKLCSFSIGALLTFLPFFIFEIRHGLEQTKTALTALINGGAGQVIIHGLTKLQIIESFLSRWSQLLHLPLNLSLVILFILLIIFPVLALKNKSRFLRQEKIMLLFLMSLAVSCPGLYLSVRNPVWDYHFIGIEIMWILILGIFLTKIPFIKYVAYFWLFLIVLMQVISFSETLRTPILTTDSLATKEYVVNLIANDAKNKTYNVYAYNSSIYTYEYSYLFRWLGKKEVPYDPGLIKKQGDIYLILPKEKTSLLDDFINYRTPQNHYKTSKSWTIPNGALILKRSLL